MAENQNDLRRQCHGGRSLENLSCTVSDVICFESVTPNDGDVESEHSSTSVETKRSRERRRSRDSRKTAKEATDKQNIFVQGNDLSTAQNRKCLSVDNGSQTEDKPIEQPTHAGIKELSQEVYRCVKSAINDIHVEQCEPANVEIHNINSNARAAYSGRGRKRGRSISRDVVNDMRHYDNGIINHSSMLASFLSLRPVKAVPSRSHSSVIVTYQPFVSGKNNKLCNLDSNNQPAVSCHDMSPSTEQVSKLIPSTNSSRDVRKEISVTYTFPNIGVTTKCKKSPGKEICPEPASSEGNSCSSQQVDMHNSPRLEVEHTDTPGLSDDPVLYYPPQQSSFIRKADPSNLPEKQDSPKTITSGHSTSDSSRSCSEGKSASCKKTTERENGSPATIRTFSVVRRRHTSPLTKKNQNKSIDTKTGQSKSPNTRKYKVMTCKSRSLRTIPYDARPINKCDKASSISCSNQDVFTPKPSISHLQSHQCSSSAFEQKYTHNWHPDKQGQDFHHHYCHCNPDQEKDNNIETSQCNKESGCSIM